MSANPPTAAVVNDESTFDETGAPRPALSARQINVARAVAAIVLGVAFLVAIGDDVPTAASVLPAAAAGIVTAYPLIDVVSSILSIPTAGAGARALRGNAAVSAVAAVAVGVAAFGSDAGATLLAFGAWAVISGAIQFVLALRRRRLERGQLSMLISGGLSALVGLSFVAAPQETDVSLEMLSVYMIVGAVLFIVSTLRRTAG